MTEKKKTGRPPKYSEAQVIEGIKIVERAGEAPTGDSVKNAMCTELKVAGGINAQSLDKEVQRLLDERDQDRRNRLVAALPPATKAAAKEIAIHLEKAILDHMAEEHDHLRSSAGKREAELREDLGSQRAQIRELLLQVDEKDSEIAALEGARYDLEQRLATASTEVDLLKDRLVDLEKEQDFRAQMFRLVKETLAENRAC